MNLTAKIANDVTPTFTPNPVTGGDGTQFTLTLAASADAPAQAAVVGYIQGTMGTVTRVYYIQTWVTGNFYLRARGLKSARTSKTPAP